MRFLKQAVLASAASAALMAAPAQAVTFNLVDTGGAGIGTQARAGFDAAAKFWSTVLTDNSTINLNIGFRALGTGILGSTGSTRRGFLVQDAYSALASDAKTTLDGVAVSNLTGLSSTIDPTLSAVDAFTSGYKDPVTKLGVDTGSRIFDNDGSANNFVLNANTANMKALGITTDAAGNDISNISDGSVTFSSTFAFDFNPTNGIADGSFDFIAIAIHEIGHALGFVSGVDTYDVVGGPNGPSQAALGDNSIAVFRIMSVLDLFRYSDNNALAGGEDALDWAVGGNTYFSIDGQNQLFGDSRFSTGRFNGDGQQASHWKDNIYAPRVNPRCSNVVTTPIGLMNPTIGNCEAGVVTALDLAAFDAIGYDLNFDALGKPGTTFTSAQIWAAVPETGTWGMMIIGFGMIGGAIRRQRVTKLTYSAA